MTPRNSGRLMLLALVAVFALPVVIGLYLYTSGFRTEGKSYGQLVQPPRKLAAVPSLDWQGKWRLVYVTDAACAAQCRATLHQLRQLHVSLAKDIDRVQRVWVLDGMAGDEVIAPVRQHYPDLLVMNGVRGMAAQFFLAGAAGDVFLVDPLGNLMMRYPAGFDPAGVRKDFVRLLAYSWTG